MTAITSNNFLSINCPNFNTSNYSNIVNSNQKAISKEFSKNINSSNIHKPLCLQIEASSWNYGSFYPINHFKVNKNTKKRDVTPPIARDTYINRNKCANEINSIKDTKCKSNNKLCKVKLQYKDKIVKDDLVKNINYLKITGTSKNISNNPSTKTNKNLNNLENKKINNYTDNNKSKSSIKFNRTINSNLDKSEMSIKIKYEDWLKAKNEELELKEMFKKAKIEEELRLSQLKEEINKEYACVKEEKIKQWKSKKNEQLKKEQNYKIKKQLLKKKEKEEKQLKSQEALIVWFQNQAHNIEKDNYLKEKQNLEKQKLEQQKKQNLEQKKIENLNAFYLWKSNKDKELSYIKNNQLVNKNNLSKHSIDTITGDNYIINHKGEKVKKHYYKKKNNYLVIGPYTNANDLRKIKNHLDENYSNEDEVIDDVDNNNNNDDAQDNVEYIPNNNEINGECYDNEQDYNLDEDNNQNNDNSYLMENNNNYCVEGHNEINEIEELEEVEENNENIYNNDDNNLHIDDN